MKTSEAVEPITRKLFHALASARHARAFHPRGLLLTGELQVWHGGGLPVPPGEIEVVARVSKGAGTPGGLPDALGLALRLPGEPGWDLTLTSSRARVLPWPATSWTAAKFSSLMPYLVDGAPLWIGARAVEPQRENGAALTVVPLEFSLCTARGRGPWQPAARLRLRYTAPDSGEPAFDPMLNHPDEVRLYPRWLARVREAAYAGSRSGRR